MSFTPEELNNEGIRDWSVIEDQFTNCPILLGNGFSLNFSETLRYKNLYDNFIQSSSGVSSQLFKEFDTCNFEEILENLEISTRVLKTIGEENTTIGVIHKEIRQGLVDSIHSIHPKPDQIDKELLKRVAAQFSSFSDIYTTNYDLFLYYIILDSGVLGDYFYFTHYPDERYKLFNLGDEHRSKHIYYLHGALFIFEHDLDTIKIKADEEHWLIDIITSEINSFNYPLFISEGSSNSKLKAIQSNSYLTYCLNNLKSSTSENLVVFGQSLSEQDHHLVRLIDESYDKIAISIRPQSWSDIRHLRSEISRISSLFTKTEFEFYDSNTLFNFE